MVFRNFLLYLIIPPVTILCYILILLSHILDPSRNFKFFISQTWLALILKILGIRMRVQGTENIDTESRYVVMGNHASALDIPVLNLALPLRLSFMAKKELFRIPFFGWSLKSVGHIPIDRKHPRKALRQMEAFVKNRKYREHSILFFPEGTRSLTGQMGEFKRGGFNFARNLGLPILPVSIRGAFALAKKGERLIRAGEISISVHKPVTVTEFESQPALMEHVRSTIASKL
jgi:1-acyl-sn-glycerol-3-phosphate acyltransferase